MLEAINPDPSLDIFREFTVEDDDPTSLLDLFPDFNDAQSEPPIPSIEDAEDLRAELFGTSSYDLEPLESLQYSGTAYFPAQNVTDDLFDDIFATPPSFNVEPVQDHRVNVRSQTPSPPSSIGGPLASPWKEAAHTELTEGLLPAFSEEPLAVPRDPEEPVAELTVDELLEENARLRALVASQAEPKTPKMTPRKRTAGLVSNDDSSPTKKTRQLSGAALTIVTQNEPIDASWSPSSLFEQGLERGQESNTTSLQRASTAYNPKPVHEDDYITREMSKMQEFVKSPPPTSPYKANFAHQINASSPPKRTISRAPKPSRRQTFSHAGALASFGVDILSSPSPISTIEPQTSSPAAKKSRTKRAPAKKSSGNKSTEKKTSVKRHQRVKSTPIPANQNKRSVQEIYALNFYSLTQEEKARLLLPLLQGIDPKDADATEAEALAQAAQNHSSSPVPVSMIPRLPTPVTTSAGAKVPQSTSASHTTHTPMPIQADGPFSPQTAEFIALGFHPAKFPPTQLDSSTSPTQLARLDNTYVAAAASPEPVTAAIFATQDDEDAHLLTQLEQFNNSSDDFTSLFPVQPTANTESGDFQFGVELADSLTGDLSQHDTTGFLTFNYIVEDPIFTLNPTSNTTADILTPNTELDAVTIPSDPTVYEDALLELDAITQFNNVFDNPNAHYSSQGHASHSPNAPSAMIQRISPSPDTNISMVSATDIGVTRQREALEKAARLQAQGRKR